MTAQRCSNRIAGILFGPSTQVIFAVTVWRLFWFLRDGRASAATSWFLCDLLLAVQFAVAHSFLLWPPVRARIVRRLTPSLYGCLYCVITCVSLWLLFVFWRGSSLVLWSLTGLACVALRGCYYLSWAALIYSLSLTGLGYQTGWTQWLAWLRATRLSRRGLIQHGFYRWLRHPVYASFLGLIWFTPRMTADRAALSVVWTLYIFVGSCLKDRRLAMYLGADYLRYAARVPGYPGMPRGLLGKWPRPSQAPAICPGPDRGQNPPQRLAA